MAQFGGGKAPPPWQTRNQATMQTSLLGQHPTGALTNQQLVLGTAQAPYATLQQSMIQPPGLGALQALVQPNIQQQTLAQSGMAQASICQATLAQPVQVSMGQPNLTQANMCQTTAHMMGQPSLSTQNMQANLASHAQLNTIPQIQPQVTTVAYPTPRPLPPPGAFANQAGVPNMVAGSMGQPIPVPGVLTGIGPVAGVNNTHSNSNVPPQKQRVFTGTITKLCADFGFVDEDVFFQTSCVKGVAPKVGERVLVEASYNPNMPFKWNANRVQVIPAPVNSSNSGNRGSMQSSASGRSNSFNAVPPPSFTSDSQSTRSLTSRARSPRRDRRDDLKRGPRDSRTDRDDKEKENKIRKRSRERSRTPPRKRPRVFPRYNVQIPNIMLHMKEANVLELRKRYASLYIPSDVFLARPLWSDTFPPHRCFQFPRPVSFHILSKEVEPMVDNDAIYDPPDINHSFAAKVMLMAVPSMEDIYRRSCALSEDPSEVRSSFVHPTRLINFLVGLKGKNETMAIGGYWSPSLDGANPEKDVNVLIRTAIRTCKALTGIDLSGCTTWYRFAEIYYRRGEFYHKGRNVPVRVETTVLFLPDVWNICSTKLEWDGLQVNYRRQLDRRLQAAPGSSEQQQTTLQPQEYEDLDEDEADHKGEEKKDPTHWNSLDPKNLKVVDLRNELNARLLNSKGLKSQLIARLTKALKLEQEKEEQEKATKMEADNVSKKDDENKKREEERRKRDDEKRREDEERKKTEERERNLLEKRYTLPEQPMLLVHPSKTAKSGKFDCTTMSLSVLLDYRQEDNKEHSFEVSLFAELFNEMLMRDFAFRIYKSIVQAPDKNKDEKKEKKDDKEDRKKEEKEDKKDKKNEKEEEKDEKEKGEEFDEEEIEEYFDEDVDDEDSKELPRHDKEKDRKKETRKDKSKREKKVRKKMITIHPHLLLSFVYFDQAHTGYIIDKDLEDIINILGVNPSRAQLKKLIGKVLSRDALYYRRLTDVSADEKDKKRELSPVDLEQLSAGNNSLLPMLCDASNRLHSKNDNGTSNNYSEEDGQSPSGVINFEGSIIDVGKLLQQLERSEKARNDTEERLKEVQKDLLSSKDEAKKVLDKHIKLSREVKYTNANLKIIKEELKKVQEDNTIYQRAVHQIKNVIGPLIPTEDIEDEETIINLKIKDENVENGT